MFSQSWRRSVICRFYNAALCSDTRTPRTLATHFNKYVTFTLEICDFIWLFFHFCLLYIEHCNKSPKASPVLRVPASDLAHFNWFRHFSDGVVSRAPLSLSLQLGQNGQVYIWFCIFAFFICWSSVRKAEVVFCFCFRGGWTEAFNLGAV